MAIGSATSVSGGGVSSVTIPTFDTTGANRFVFYGVSLMQWQANVNSVVRGGAETATQKWSQRSSDATYTSYGGYFISPATATATAVVTLSESVTEVHASALPMDEVHQTTPTGTHGSTNGTGTTASVTVTAAADETLIDVMVAANWRAPTAGADQTERWSLYSGSIRGAGSSQPGTADDVMSWGLTDSVVWATGAVPIKPAIPPQTYFPGLGFSAQQRMG